MKVGNDICIHGTQREKERDKKIVKRESERSVNSEKEMESQSPRSIDYIEGRRVTFLLIDFCENRATAFTC